VIREANRIQQLHCRCLTKIILIRCAEETQLDKGTGYTCYQMSLLVVETMVGVFMFPPIGSLELLPFMAWEL